MIIVLIVTKNWNCKLHKNRISPFLKGTPLRYITESYTSLWKERYSSCSNLPFGSENLRHFEILSDTFNDFGKKLLKLINFKYVLESPQMYLHPASLLKKNLAQVFSHEFCKHFKNTVFTKHLQTINSG